MVKIIEMKKYIYFLIFFFLKKISKSDSLFDFFQIESKNFKILFRKEAEWQAIRVLDILEGSQENLLKEFQKKNKKKTLIILENKDAISNGMTYPNKTILYTLPPQDQDPLDWIYSLCIHEGRHLIQFSNFLGFLDIPFHTIPESWLFEGDAVFYETLFSSGGRGRLPFFYSVFRKNILEKKNYFFFENYLGSIKNRLPDHYVVGFFMNVFLRKKYGDDILIKISDEKKGYKSLNLKIKNITKLDIESLYKEMIEDLYEKWKNQNDKIIFTDCINIYETNKKNIEYIHPIKINEDEFICYKNDFDQIGSFVFYSISKKKEEKIVDIRNNISFQDGFSFCKDKICYSKRIGDKFFSNRGISYLEIIIYDIKKKKTSKINHKTRYQSPVFSCDGEKILAVESSDSGKNYLVILSEKGKILNKIKFEKDEYIKNPNWSFDQKNAVFVLNKCNKSYLLIIDLKSNEKKIILEGEYEQISKPFFYKNFILFSSPINGIDNLHAIDINTKDRFIITQRPYGGYNFSFFDQSIIFNDLNSFGFYVCEFKIDEKKWIKFSKENIFDDFYFNEKKYEEKILEEKNYKVEKYNIFQNGIYNWKLDLNGSISSTFSGNLFLKLKSKDFLSIFENYFGIGYKINEKKIFSRLEFIYKGFIPIINFSGNFEYSFLNLKKLNFEKFNEKKKIPRSNLSFSISLPYFNDDIFYSKKYFLNYNTNFNYEYFTKKKWITNFYKFQFERSSAISKKMTIPKYFQNLSFEFGHFVYPKKLFGKYLDISLQLYFSFFLKNGCSGIFLNYFKNENSKLEKEEKISFLSRKYNYLKSEFINFKYFYDFPIVFFDYYLGFFSFHSLNFISSISCYYLIKLKEWYPKYHPSIVGLGVYSKGAIMRIPFQIGFNYYFIPKNENYLDKKNKTKFEVNFNLSF